MNCPQWWFRFPCDPSSPPWLPSRLLCWCRCSQCCAGEPSGWGLVSGSSPPPQPPPPLFSSSCQDCRWPPAATKPCAPATSASASYRWGWSTLAGGRLWADERSAMIVPVGLSLLCCSRGGWRSLVERTGEVVPAARVQNRSATVRALF